MIFMDADCVARFRQKKKEVKYLASAGTACGSPLINNVPSLHPRSSVVDGRVPRSISGHGETSLSSGAYCRALLGLHSTICVSYLINI